MTSRPEDHDRSSPTRHATAELVSFTVYAPEFPGTSVGDPYAIHAVDHLSDIVLIYEEVTRALGLRKPVVVGQSFGGMIAAELCAAYPDLAAKVVLLDPIGLWRPDIPVANWMATPPDQLPGLLFHDPAGFAAQSMLAMPDDPDLAVAATAGMVSAAALAAAVSVDGSPPAPVLPLVLSPVAGVVSSGMLPSL